MIERGSGKHSPELDDQIEQETEGMIRGNQPTRVEEHRETEPFADDTDPEAVQDAADLEQSVEVGAGPEQAVYNAAGPEQSPQAAAEAGPQPAQDGANLEQSVQDAAGLERQDASELEQTAEAEDSDEEAR